MKTPNKETTLPLLTTGKPNPVKKEVDKPSKEEKREEISKNQFHEEKEEEQKEEEEKEVVNKNEENNDNEEVEDEKEPEENQMHPEANLTEEDIKKKEQEYIVQIEELKNELEIEKKISANIHFDPLIEEEIQRRKFYIEQKNNKLTQLKNTNARQQVAIDNLTREMEAQIEKEKDAQKEKEKEKGNEKEKESSIDVVIKVKNNEISKAMKLVDTLSKENKVMKTLIDTSADYKIIIKTQDSNKVKDEIISKLIKEKDFYDKQLEDHHNKCIKDQKEWENEENELKEKIKKAKEEYFKNNEMYKKNFKVIDKEKIQKARIKAKKERSSQPPQKKVIIPMSEQMYNESVQVLDNKVKENLKTIINNDTEFDTLMVKIQELEYSRSMLDVKHKAEEKQYMEKEKVLEKELKVLLKENKDIESNNKLMMRQLKELRNEQKNSQKTLIDYQNQIDHLQNLSKEKEQEIKLLTHQLNTMRKIIKNGSTGATDIDISSYIEKIKKENATKSVAN